MNASTDYKPLTLKAQKGTPAVKIGEVHLYDKTHIVSVSRLADGQTYRVRVRIGNEGGFVDAGLLTRYGSQWHINSFQADSKPGPGTGYMERGTLASNTERVVSEFLNSVEYAAKEAAKTPEQKQAEEQAREEALNAVRNRTIASKAQELIDTLERFVPATTMHYAVEDVRTALVALILEAEQNNIKTRGI